MIKKRSDIKTKIHFIIFVYEVKMKSNTFNEKSKLCHDLNIFK